MFLLHFMIAGSILAVVLAFRSLLASEATNDPSDHALDPVEVTMRAYTESSAQLSGQGTAVTAEQKMQWRQDWLQRLLTVAADNPKSNHRPRALRECARLANAAGDFALSQSIIRQVLETISGEPLERIVWLAELGEAGKAEFRQNESNAARESAVAALEEANGLIRDSLEVTPSAKDSLTEQLVLNLAWIGDVLSVPSATKDELCRAAQSYGKARQVLQAYGEPRGRLTGLGYDPELLAGHEAVSAVRGGDNEASSRALDFLRTLPNKKQPMYLYVKACAERAFAMYGKEYTDFIEGWLKETPEDEGTAVLKCLVADSYLRSKEYDKAAALYEELNTTYVDALMKIDKDAIRQGRGGYYADVLCNLRVYYTGHREYAKAIAVNRRFLELYPNYGSLTKEAEGMQAWLEGQIDSTNRKAEKKAAERKEIDELMKKDAERRMKMNQGPIAQLPKELPVSERLFFGGSTAMLVVLVAIFIRRRWRR